MIWTTKIKITLKKNLPNSFFKIIRFTADRTILKILPVFFNFKVRKFTRKITKDIFYGEGKKFFLILNPENGYLDAYIYAHGLYEPHIVRELINNINEGDTCIDIGANIGHHAIIMAQIVGVNGKINAYEPIPFIRTQMEESIALNNLKNVTIIPEALSNKEGELILNVNVGNVAGSSFVNKEDGNQGLSINTRTLDSYNYSKISFIKLDVEGFEYSVLQGAEKTISSLHPVVLFEYSPTYYKKNSATDSKDILLFFKKYNYKLIDLEDNRKEITNVDGFVKEFEDGLRSQTNILAV